MKKLKDLTIKEKISDIFSKALISGNLKIFKTELLKAMRGHDKLWDKDLPYVNRSVVGGVYDLAGEWLEINPQILIIPFPVFSSRYDGWQIVTEKTKIDELMKQIEEERYRKHLRRWYQLWIKIREEKKAAQKIGLLPEAKAKDIEKEEAEPYKKLKPYTLLHYDSDR